MKIVQRGINLKTTWPKPIICPKCGCIFQVQKASDVIWAKVGIYKIDTMVIKCPNSSCSFEQTLSSEKIKWVKENIEGAWNHD